MSSRVASDVVKGVFHYIPAKKRFPADIPKIHEIFFEMSQKEEYSDLFDAFIFDSSQPYPYSRSVEFALDRLQIADLLCCRNPGLKEFEITTKLYEEQITDQIFDTDEKELLKAGATFFVDKISS